MDGVIQWEQAREFEQLIAQLSPAQLRQLQRLMLRVRDDCPACALVPDDDRRGGCCGACLALPGDVGRPVARVN